MKKAEIARCLLKGKKVIWENAPEIKSRTCRVSIKWKRNELEIIVSFARLLGNQEANVLKEENNLIIELPEDISLPVLAGTVKHTNLPDTYTFSFPLPKE